MEARLFEEGTVPECTTPEWYAGRERAPHLEEGAHQARLHRTNELVRGFIDDAGAGYTVVDLGAGDGGLLQLVATNPPDGLVDAFGYDLQQTNVAGAAERGVDVRLGDCVAGEISWGTVLCRRIAVATEMLEHLVDPHTFVAKIGAEADYLVASSPYTETAESHYAFHTWAWDFAGYEDLLRQNGWRPVVHEPVGGMFQVIAAIRKPRW